MPSHDESTLRRVLRSVVLIALLVGLGGMVAGGLVAIRKTPPRRELAILPPLVETLRVEARDVVEYFVGYGSAVAIHRAQIAAELSGLIVERVGGIREGTAVERDQVLFRLDDRSYRHALARAEALAAAERAGLEELEVRKQGLETLMATAQRETHLAREERNRVASLFERELAAKQEFDTANLAYQQALRVLQGYELERAELGPRSIRAQAAITGFEQEAALAGLNIDRCEIRAPFTGEIESLLADLGDHVAAGTVLATLVDRSQVEVPVRLAAGFHDRLVHDVSCTLTAEATAGGTWTGVVDRVSPTADATTRTCTAYVVVTNASGRPPLVPGMFVTARIDGPTHVDGLLVPRGACRDGRVLVADGDRARTRAVVVERYLEDFALVRGELRDGDLVILSRLDRLADGSPIRTRESGPATGHVNRADPVETESARP